MNAYVLIPFGVFAVCCVVLPTLQEQMINLLEHRAREQLARFRRPLMMNWRLQRFLMNMETVPGTPLRRRQRAIRWWYGIALGSWAACGLFFLVGR